MIKKTMSQKNINKKLKLGAIATCIALGGTALTMADDEKILFVGNSYTDYNVLSGQVEAMIETGGDDAVTKRQTKGGFSWKKHWDAGEAQKRIENEEEWDFIVLQNHSRSSLDKRDSFDEYGQKFIDLVKDTDAEPVLYMTWSRKHLPEEQAVITEAYSSLGDRNDIKVAPVGLAFESWMKEHPAVPLHVHDNSHPSPEGSYLAACVIYATLTGKSPVGMPNVIEGANWVTGGQHLAFIDPARAAQLQETAWKTVQAYNPKSHASDEPLRIAAAAPVAAAPQSSANDIKINFGGKAAPGWNKVGSQVGQPIPLVNSGGQPTGATIQVTDAFESYENPNVVKAPLTGAAAAFEGAKAATLFTNRAKGNPTGAIQVSKLDPSKTYTFQIWASRAASGKRWGKYIVTGAAPQTQFLAAGGDYDATGNVAEVLTFANIQPDANGNVTLTVEFPAEGDPKINIGDFTYLTGMIVSAS
ncbi:hypothetical protein [Rubellicoccus peritrichatus]|uniref:DUF4886 domain-containing protein n=1 Tax=Rubellicoccus peritrichatus TaxID=3080537 RepID=A0AAQ3LA45_9BACT|nr:hypothetical protein [Puniceicoccus sp. CR14]WOO41487.1 hypothetical protein RZN69_00200 [Puniceicoccus sp. CR14]